MIYDKSFWPEDVNEIILLHTEEQQSIELSESIQKELLKNENIDVQTIQMIIQAIHRYDVLPSTDIPVLITWFGGPAALVIEDFSAEIIGQICHEVLCNCLNISSKFNQPIRTLK